ncbi:RtcB family protein [Caldanaerobacter subterraneus]|uniref:tRNA-splicing ligase RtcB n=1 Tax=Caldanaerobacter subterraneus TaxID=911092 RepID=A0A4R2KMZ3_9THEO|nr:RtcB family protein [Caldanaerobacter subterraneus]MBE3578845.1 RtcB family protein [Caldanaerobacter subterraneus]TCO67935.1 tRNA-splicing ligase RtcB [Caldanaerobacter subterraneus]
MSVDIIQGYTLVKDGINKWRIPKFGKMRVDAVVYVNDSLKDLLRDDQSLRQLVNAASLPGVVEPVIGMPDIHEGFGLPIGGVMAIEEKGVISAGAVGYDINCGVRLVRSDLEADYFTKDILYKLIERIEHYVPTGIGKKGKHKGITRVIFDDVVHNGVEAVIKAGFGKKSDLEYIEEGGKLEGADISAVSEEAQERGEEQLGTLGGGNHFIEIQKVEEILEENLAEKFGLFKGQLAVMIHTGSRGFGHQIATDYTKILWEAAKRYGIEVPEKGLAAAPIKSKEGQNYYKAMAAAVNFAFSNRQIIMFDVIRAFEDVLKKSEEEMGFKLVYDVAHNIAKWEVHGGKRMLVHRKGATRALPAGHPQNPPSYRDTGHPALIPGSMGTGSYVVVGTEKAAETFYSVNHGAGRRLSRNQAKKISKEEFERSMGDVVYNVRSYKDIVDESPLAYKDVEAVVSVLEERGITIPVAKLIPLAVVKGAD